MAPFCGWGSTASRLEPLQGGSLLFTTKFPEIPGISVDNTHIWSSYHTDRNYQGARIQCLTIHLYFRNSSITMKDLQLFIKIYN